MLETLAATNDNRDNASELIRQLDSIMRAGPAGLRSGPSRILTRSPGVLQTTTGIAGTGFEDFGGLVVARMYEKRGNVSAALAAVQRQPYYWNATGYLSSYLRAEARLAEAAGDTQRAIAALRHYITLRSNVELALTGDVESARLTLSRLEAAS